MARVRGVRGHQHTLPVQERVQEVAAVVVTTTAAPREAARVAKADPLSRPARPRSGQPLYASSSCACVSLSRTATPYAHLKEHEVQSPHRTSRAG